MITSTLERKKINYKDERESFIIFLEQRCFPGLGFTPEAEKEIIRKLDEVYL